MLIPFSTLAGPEIALMNEPTYEDPDGPLEGGLDDLQDWIHLANGILLLGYYGKKLLITDVRDMDTLLTVVVWLISISGLFGLRGLLEFAEAFDIMELKKDGL